MNAAYRMANRGHTIILANRSLQKSKDTMDRMLSTSNKDLDIIAEECDLSDLNSVKSFASRCGDGIDILCLNAGISRNVKAKDVLRTKQGFELTVGINHFGHFYLTQLLLPKLNPSSRIVVTASGVHDPESPGGAQGSTATLGTLDGITKYGRDFEMIDGNAYDPDKAYKDSKLCNVLFTRELQRRLDSDNKNIIVNCFSPGLIVGTGLFRDQNPIFTKIFDFAATDLLKVGETTEWGGGALEYMALSSDIKNGGLYFNSPPGSSKYGDDAYGKQFAVTQVSKEVREEGKAKLLWDYSTKLLDDAVTA